MLVFLIERFKQLSLRLDKFSLFELLCMEFPGTRLLAIASEVFDAHSDTADSDGVELFDAVVVAAVLIL